MVSEEVKDTIYLAIGCIVVALLLGFVAFILQARSEFANTYNNEKSAQLATESYLKFEKYNGKVIYGNELVALIREFYGTETLVFIDGIAMRANNDNQRLNSSIYRGTNNWDGVSGSYILLDMDKAEHINEVRAGNNGKIDGNIYYDIEDLTVGTSSRGSGNCPYGIDESSAYFVYLVMGLYSPDDIANAPYVSQYVDLSDDSVGIDFSNVSAVVVKHIKKDGLSLSNGSVLKTGFNASNCCYDMQIKGVAPYSIKYFNPDALDITAFAG